MAILSNINGKFAVDSTGAIQFSGSAGTSGYILRSNGNAAPTWVDSSTVIGGPYLPLTGGTLSGALAGTSATFSSTLTVGATTITSATNPLLLTLNSTASGYGGILFQYGGATKGLSYYNSNMMIFGGEAGTATRLQAGGQYILHADATNQNVHIGGNSNSTYKLQVTGTSYTSGNATFGGTVEVNGSNVTVIKDSDPALTVSDTDTNYRGSMRWLSSSNVLEFFTRYAGTYYTNNLVLDRGKVGIGTNTPTEKLDVSGTAIVRSTLFTVGNVHGFTSSYGASFFINNGGGTTYFNATGGNVGIGTNSPIGVKFQTVQTTSGEWTGGFKNYTANGYGLRIDMSNSSSVQSALQVYTGAGTGFVVKNNGLMGIGTFTPAQKLDVVGQVTHDGLVMKSGTGLYIDTVTTFNITLDFVAGNWVSTGLTSVSNNGLTLGNAGTYIMQIYSDDHSPGEPYWYSMYWSGIMSWYNSSTNQANTQNPIVLQKAGHGDNNRSLEAQILWQTASGTPANNGLLQLKCNATAPGTTLRLRFRRLI